MKIITNLIVILSLFTPLNLTADIFSNLSDSDRLSLQQEIRHYLLNNPEIILEAVKSLEGKTRKNEEDLNISLIQSNYDELFNDNVSWQGGNLNGDVTIIEFIDYRCGYCRKAHKEITKTIKSDQNIKLIIKEYPILGEQSLLSARLAISVLQNNSAEDYKKVHDKLMNANINLDETSMVKLLENLNINSTNILNHMNSKEVTNHLRKIRVLGQRLKIQGTPTFVIEDKIVRGYIDFDQLNEIIKNIR